jgi:O-antigen/teichoic acid export membrane protein
LSEAPRQQSRFSFAFDRTVVATVLTGFAGQAALIIPGVLIARALNPYFRGQLALIVAIAVSTSYIISLGMPTAVAFATAREGGSALGALRSIRRWLIAQLVTGFVLTAMVIAFAVNGSGRSDTFALIAVPPATVALMVVMYGLAVLQGRNRFAAFNTLRLLPAVGYAIGAIAVVLAGRLTVSAVVVAWSFTTCFAALVIAIYVTRVLRDDDGKTADSRELVAYGLKAQIGTASPLENFQIDQLIVGAIAGPLALGYYVIAAAFTNLPRFIAQSLGMVVFPRVAGRLSSGGARLIASQALWATVLLAGGTVLLLEISLGVLVPFFFGDDYTSSIEVARIMLLASLCFSLRRVLGDSLRGANKPLPGTIAEIIAWIVYGSLVVPLTLSYDAVGAAWALVIGAAASLTYISWAARRVARALPTISVPVNDSPLTPTP